MRNACWQSGSDSRWFFKQNENWKNPNGTYGPKLPRSSPQVITKGHQDTKWSVHDQSKVPTWFSFLPGFDNLPQRKHFWLGRCFLWSLAYCLVFGRSDRIYLALWVFQKKCFFCVVDEFLWFRWYFSFASWPAEWYLTHCCFSCQAGLYKLYILLPSALHSQRAPMIKGFLLALQIHFERMTELRKLLFFTILKA